MRIVLIEPARAPVSTAGEDVFLLEPAALGHVAAGVSDEREANILSQRIDDSVDETLEEIYEHDHRRDATAVPPRHVIAFERKPRPRDVPANILEFKRRSKRLRHRHAVYGPAC